MGVLYECCKVKMKCRCHKMKWEWRTCDTTRVYGSLPFCISLIPRSSILFAINSIFYILLNIYNMYLERVTLSLRCCKINERFSIQVPRHGKTWVRMQLFFFSVVFFCFVFEVRGIHLDKERSNKYGCSAVSVSKST